MNVATRVLYLYGVLEALVANLHQIVYHRDHLSLHGFEISKNLLRERYFSSISKERELVILCGNFDNDNKSTIEFADMMKNVVIVNHELQMACSFYFNIGNNSAALLR